MELGFYHEFVSYSLLISEQGEHRGDHTYSHSTDFSDLPTRFHRQALIKLTRGGSP